MARRVPNEELVWPPSQSMPSGLLTLVRSLTGRRGVLKWEPEPQDIDFEGSDELVSKHDALQNAVDDAVHVLWAIGRGCFDVIYRTVFFRFQRHYRFRCGQLLAILSQAVQHWTCTNTVCFDFPVPLGVRDPLNFRVLQLVNVHDSLRAMTAAYASVRSFPRLWLVDRLLDELVDFQQRQLLPYLLWHCWQERVHTSRWFPHLRKRMVALVPQSVPRAMFPRMLGDDVQYDTQAYCFWFMLEAPGLVPTESVVAADCTRARQQQDHYPKATSYRGGISALVADDTAEAKRQLLFASAFNSQAQFEEKAREHLKKFQALRRNKKHHGTRAVWEITGHGTDHKELQESPHLASCVQVDRDWVKVIPFLTTFIHDLMIKPAERTASLFLLSYCSSAGTPESQQLLAKVCTHVRNRSPSSCCNCLSTTILIFERAQLARDGQVAIIAFVDPVRTLWSTANDLHVFEDALLGMSWSSVIRRVVERANGGVRVVAFAGNDRFSS